MINFDIDKLANAAKELQKETKAGDTGGLVQNVIQGLQGADKASDAGGLVQNVIQGLQGADKLSGITGQATEQVTSLLKSLIGQAQGLVQSSSGKQDALNACIQKGLALLAKREIDIDAVTKLTAELGERMKKAPAAEAEPAATKSMPVADEVSRTETAIEFTDVDKNAYYYNAVQWAVKNGIASGTTATTFNPNGACTRAQAVTLIWRASGSPAPKNPNNPFADVKTGAYYYDAVLWAVEKGITAGTTETTFQPDATVTRGQVATFLYRNAGSPTVNAAHDFQDVAADKYYAKPVAWIAAKGVPSGTDANTFCPDDVCTRGQIATFLYGTK